MALTDGSGGILVGRLEPKDESLDELLKWSTINFPKLIADPVELFLYFRQKGGLMVEYTQLSQMLIGSYIAKPRKNEKPIVDVMKLHGEIIQPKGSKINFKCIKFYDDEGVLGFSGMEFDRTPGYEKRDYMGEKVALWDKVRALTKQYFKKK